MYLSTSRGKFLVGPAATTDIGKGFYSKDLEQFACKIPTTVPTCFPALGCVHGQAMTSHKQSVQPRSSIVKILQGKRMSALAIQHINIKCADLDSSRAFYSVLGLKDGYRPPFSSKGSWMYLDSQPIVHLVQTTPEHRLSAEEVAKFHIAFESDDIQGMRRALKDHGIAFKEALVPNDKSTQFFMHDPDGVQIELNFPNWRTEPQV